METLMNKVYKTIMNQASEIEEGATVIENIATKKHCCEEASRVGVSNSEARSIHQG